MFISESFTQIDGNVERMEEILHIPVLPDYRGGAKEQGNGMDDDILVLAFNIANILVHSGIVHTPNDNVTGTWLGERMGRGSLRKVTKPMCRMNGRRVMEYGVI